MSNELALEFTNFHSLYFSKTDSETLPVTGFNCFRLPWRFFIAQLKAFKRCLDAFNFGPNFSGFIVLQLDD